MTIVQIEKPEDTKLADWFAELRLWFDNNDCSPILFTAAGRVINRERFNIKFADAAHAHLFASSFAHYGPSILRLIGGEPSGLQEGAPVDERVIGN